MLLQAITSLVSGALFLNPFAVQGDIAGTMRRFAGHAAFVQAGIAGDIVTALGIIALAAVLYAAVGQRNKPLALVALGFYILEAGILVVSKIAVFALLHISQEYIATGEPSLETMANLALAAKDFTYRVHMIPFGLGATIFYYLLYRSNIVPAWLALWGLVAVPFVLVGSVWAAFAASVPPVLLALAIPYVPFEFFAGAFLLVRGFQIENRKDLTL
ncbi:MAG: DUF4386 domain-containing protein [Paenibacillaceae bacterium]|nr:DUF4386 domain-containing protein [Paenibacillaceae bacterium]